MIRLTTRGPAETLELGRWIGQRLEPGMTVGLDGDLGMGKTWMTKGLVQGIGDFDPTQVKSPAFNLVHEYPVSRGGAGQDVIHIDFYRLDELSHTDALLFGEYLDRQEVIACVEWAGKFLAELVPSYLSIRLALCPPDDASTEDLPERGDLCREIQIHAIGAGYDALLDEIRSHANART
ncbi:MAG: tRNA (adenosine(37)-N6)-threonylcarbamoyltransferase complex ATPase subunit type 1 TsaE [Holophagales bacterium]|nr:tRNA (adenosine(37)-N6)-threonylcarbamoyltransferase complex ATPase subunit type 1 TsaE [Holophagales bacterium]